MSSEAAPLNPGSESNASKITEWSNEPSVLALKEDLTAAQPAHDGHVLNVKRWNDLRNVTGSSAIKKVRGRSSVQPKLIRRQAEWRYSALAEPFLSSDKLFNVKPVTFEDEHGARQNELVLNWQFRTHINHVSFVDQYIRTGVDEGTVLVRLGWEREVETVPSQDPVFEFLPIMENDQDSMQILEQAMELKHTNPREYWEIPEEIQAAVDFFEEQEIPTIARIVRYEEGEEEKIKVNRPTLQIMNFENVFIDPSCEGDLDKARFIIISFETSKAELLKDARYTNLKNVNWSGNTILSQPDHETQTPTDFNFKDELRRRVVAYEYWGLWDVNGDEKLVPIVATWIGDVMIRMEENPFPDEKPPFVLVPYLPVKRQLTGEPDAEILEDNQRILGAMTRGMIDLMGRSANSQQGMAKGFLDVTNRRRFESGLDYEFNPGAGDPRLSIHQHTYPEIPNSALTMVNMQNSEAEALSGVKAFSGGLSGNAYGDVATGIKGMLDASSKREMNILRRLAKGMQDIGKKIIQMNAVFMSEREVVRVTNAEYVTVLREDLKGNFDCIVDISTPEVDEAKSHDLGMMLQTIGPDMEQGIRNLILADIAELKRMPQLAEKIRNFEPQPDPMMEKMKELELLKLQKEIEKLDSEIQFNMARAGKAKTEADLGTLDFVEQESGTKHERDLQKQRAQSEGNQQLEITKAMLNPPEGGKPKIPSTDPERIRSNAPPISTAFGNAMGENFS